MIRACLILIALGVASALSSGIFAQGRYAGERGKEAKQTEFSRESPEVSGSEVHITPREERRIEHFLEAVFPERQMRRFAWLGGRTAEFPVSRHVTYAVISQQGLQFVLVGYRAEWKAGEEREAAVNELAIYRMEPAGPNQVWRSRPWAANYSALHFRAAKSAWRTVILFQDGDQEGEHAGEFALASVFSFYNTPTGLLIRDLTPTLPWLRAHERFPFRTIYGQDITFRINSDGELFLSASDEPYFQGKSTHIRQSRSWKFDNSRGRFDLSRFGMMTLSDRARHSSGIN
ncbi:MAG TPA: hypothetical protein VFX22_07670 [Candidatus Kapabacteria bacterium]|nr:hypothetical protein [Candidatus Kapabacteria bacterium]